MSPSTTSPLHAMPVLDVPFPRTVAASPARGDASGPQRPAAAYPSNKKTIIGADKPYMFETVEFIKVGHHRDFSMPVFEETQPKCST